MTGRVLRTSDLDYRLPPELIAQHPAAARDQSRLLVVDRESGRLRDTTFSEFPGLFDAGDLLVLNDTKVLPAKLHTTRESGGRIDGLFLCERGSKRWEVMLRGRGRLRVGQRLTLQPDDFGDVLELVSHEGRGRWLATLVSDRDTFEVLERVGTTPLPPYIHRAGGSEGVDSERYQTVFAAHPGAVAAPTASLHFTRDILDRLDDRGVGRGFVTLHVGPGTFAPVTVDALDDHEMHAEWASMPESTVAQIGGCRRRGGRVVAAGTTAVRVLESWASAGEPSALVGLTDIFIKPPHVFGAVDVLLTNFHLPRSTLLALVMAFAGVELTREVYAHAIDQHYRFYSYGDAMVIL